MTHGRFFGTRGEHIARWISTARRLGRHELGSMLSFAGLASGLWIFVEVADEVTEGETQALDRWLLLALRNPHDASDPRGPRWLEEMARDVTALGVAPCSACSPSR